MAAIGYSEGLAAAYGLDLIHIVGVQLNGEKNTQDERPSAQVSPCWAHYLPWPYIYQ